MKNHGGYRKGSGRKKKENPRNKTLSFTVSEIERKNIIAILEEEKKQNKKKSRVETLIYILTELRK